MRVSEFAAAAHCFNQFTCTIHLLLLLNNAPETTGPFITPPPPNFVGDLNSNERGKQALVLLGGIWSSIT